VSGVGGVYRSVPECTRVYLHWSNAWLNRVCSSCSVKLLLLLLPLVLLLLQLSEQSVSSETAVVAMVLATLVLPPAVIPQLLLIPASCNDRSSPICCRCLLLLPLPPLALCFLRLWTDLMPLLLPPSLRSVAAARRPPRTRRGWSQLCLKTRGEE
jgi:hypothetical protein